MARSNENRDSDLFAYLQQIDDRLQEICDAGYALDPDQVIDELRLDTSFVQESIDALMAELLSSPERYVDLNALASVASRELVISANFPIVVKTTADPHLPPLQYPHEILLAMVLRALQLAADHAGSGCHIQIATAHDDDRALLRIVTTGHSGTSALPIRLRCISLTDLLRNLGGDVTVSDQAESLELTLFFGINAPIT